jgi:hypothetical protein
MYASFSVVSAEVVACIYSAAHSGPCVGMFWIVLSVEINLIFNEIFYKNNLDCVVEVKDKFTKIVGIANLLFYGLSDTPLVSEKLIK